MVHESPRSSNPPIGGSIVDPGRLESAYRKATEALLRRQGDNGSWEGRLSSSALATATAVSAFSMAFVRGANADGRLIDNAVDWLLGEQNADGGWGDTPQSASNIATTMLVVAALKLAGQSDGETKREGDVKPELESTITHVGPSSNSARADGTRRVTATLERAEAYIRQCGGRESLERRYGKDRTFAVPILMNCALAGMNEWNDIPALPFELACLPQSWYRFMRLPVVSYAIPALVAVGQAIHHHKTRYGFLGFIIRPLRRVSVEPSLRVLDRMQPKSGGYLEAMPLTSFVCMALASTGKSDHPVVQRGLQFLRDTVREDGSWPIDTNLATWNTTLAINALRGNESTGANQARRNALPWLLSCQFTETHPFTGAEPGGWGWSSLSGAVPDADDTAGALMALDQLRGVASEAQRKKIGEAAANGARWLIRLQNRGGGWPTFCRGWGKLPFDRSGTDLTAHAIRALGLWRTEQNKGALDRACRLGWSYLRDQQNSEGSWTPLWFGNQRHPEEENPIYGTAKALMAYRDAGRESHESIRARKWLLAQQNDDGGWGAHPADPKHQPLESEPNCAREIVASTVEETALALEALLAAGARPTNDTAIQRGIAWLIAAVESGSYVSGSPIGLYFAKLWYDEATYPLVFAVSALGEAVRRFGENPLRAGIGTGPTQRPQASGSHSSGSQTS